MEYSHYAGALPYDGTGGAIDTVVSESYTNAAGGMSYQLGLNYLILITLHHQLYLYPYAHNVLNRCSFHLSLLFLSCPAITL